MAKGLRLLVVICLLLTSAHVNLRSISVSWKLRLKLALNWLRLDLHSDSKILSLVWSLTCHKSSDKCPNRVAVKIEETSVSV